MAATTRDKRATWQSTRALGWSKPRVVYALQDRLLQYRTWPPGHVIDWADPAVEQTLDAEASTVMLILGVSDVPGVIGLKTLDVEIEVRPSTDADEVPAPSADASAATPAPRRPSDAAVDQCVRDILKERNERKLGPLNQDEMLAEMTKPERLGASPGIRERLRTLWPQIAPEWKRPRGHPRNFISAKKSAE